MAPDLPMATVATGMPAGICTMDSKESIPLSERDSTGTPITGRVSLSGDHARQMRRAARAGDNDLYAAPEGFLGVLKQQIRSAMRRDDASLIGDAESSERIGGMEHGFPVGAAPHHHADQRFIIR